MEEDIVNKSQNQLSAIKEVYSKQATSYDISKQQQQTQSVTALQSLKNEDNLNIRVNAIENQDENTSERQVIQQNDNQDKKQSAGKQLNAFESFSKGYWSFMKQIDAYKKPIYFTYKGQQSVSTRLGSCCSFFVIIMTAIYGFYMLERFKDRRDSNQSSVLSVDPKRLEKQFTQEDYDINIAFRVTIDESYAKFVAFIELYEFSEINGTSIRQQTKNVANLKKCQREDFHKDNADFDN